MLGGLKELSKWWSDLRPLTRYAVASLFLAAGVAMLVFGGIWPVGLGIGLVLLLSAGSSSSDEL